MENKKTKIKDILQNYMVDILPIGLFILIFLGFILWCKLTKTTFVFQKNIGEEYIYSATVTEKPQYFKTESYIMPFMNQYESDVYYTFKAEIEGVEYEFKYREDYTLTDYLNSNKLISLEQKVGELWDRWDVCLCLDNGQQRKVYLTPLFTDSPQD